jgi:hypothetical protein
MDELITPILVNLPQGELTAKEEILLHRLHHLHPILKNPNKGSQHP